MVTVCMTTGASFSMSTLRVTPVTVPCQLPDGSWICQICPNSARGRAYCSANAAAGDGVAFVGKGAVVAVFLGKDDEGFVVDGDGNHGLFAFGAAVDIEAGEVVARDGEAALPAVAGCVGGEGGGQEFERLAVVEGGGNAVVNHINLQYRGECAGTAGEGQRDVVGVVGDVSAGQGQRQAVKGRSFAADIGVRFGLGRHGYVVPFAGNGGGRGVARGGAGGQPLRHGLRQASAGGEALLCGGRLNGAAVRSGNGRLNGAGAAF